MRKLSYLVLSENNCPILKTSNYEEIEKSYSEGYIIKCILTDVPEETYYWATKDGQSVTGYPFEAAAYKKEGLELFLKATSPLAEALVM